MKSFKINSLDLSETWIHLILSSRCNFKCPYCVASEVDQYKGVLDKHKSELSVEDIDYICEHINSNNIRLIIVGGEPLLSKNLNYLLNKTKDKKFKAVELLTNGSILLNNVNFNEKTIAIFTYHPYKTEQKNLVKNLIYCKKNSIPIEMYIMLPQDKHYQNIDKFLGILKALNIQPLPIYPNDDFKELKFRQFKYSFEDFKVFQCDNDKNLLSFRDVCSKELNHFKGWKCYNNLFLIDINRKVRQCTGEILGDVGSFDFTKIEQICKLDYCIYEGFLRALKTKI